MLRVRHGSGSKLVSLFVLGAFTLASCAKGPHPSLSDADSSAAAPVRAVPSIPEKLAALEKDENLCRADGISKLTEVYLDIRELQFQNLSSSPEIAQALEQARTTDVYYGQVRKLAKGCQDDEKTAADAKARIAAEGLLTASASESAAILAASDRGQQSCTVEQKKNLALASRILTGLGQTARERLAATITACGELEKGLVEKSELARMHAKLKQLNACTLDSRAFAEESLADLADFYQKVSLPNRANQVLGLQLHVELAQRFQQALAGCSPEQAGEPALRITQLEIELAQLTSRADACRVMDPFEALKAKIPAAELSDAAALLSRAYQKAVATRYANFRANLASVMLSCAQNKEENLKKAQLFAALEAWRQFEAEGSYSQPRLEAYARLAAQVQTAEAQDKSLDLTPAGREQLDRGYRELRARMQAWSDRCRAALEEERKKQEEEKRKEEERKKAEEERRKEEERKKQEEEQKRKQEEEKRKQEEERKRKEEEKRKQEEERKKQEEEKRKQEEERKKQEEEKRKQEEERKKQEEEKRKEEERKKQEEEKRKQEEERKRKEEEQKRKQEEEKRKQEEERKRKEEEEKRKHPDLKQREEWEQKRKLLTPPRWGEAPARKTWTDTVVKVVYDRLADFDKARDAGDYCPGYKTAEPYEKANCWLLIITAISERESNFRPGDDMTEPNGVDSIGLLALSEGECPNAKSAKELRDPHKNLICGVNRMANLIARDGLIDGSNVKNGEEVGQAKGATAYWSTLKPRHRKFNKRTGKWFKRIGFKDEIVAIASKYKTKR